MFIKIAGGDIKILGSNSNIKCEMLLFNLETVISMTFYPEDYNIVFHCVNGDRSSPTMIIYFKPLEAYEKYKKLIITKINTS